MSPGIGTDRAVRVTVPEDSAEAVGAILMESMGPFVIERAEQACRPASSGRSGPVGSGPSRVVLVFFPLGDRCPSATDVLEELPRALRDTGGIEVESCDVSRDWEEGWREHFRPITIGTVRIRPPWVEPLPAVDQVTGTGQGAPATGSGGPRIDVVINPGLGFGTGLHPTTRGTLRLLQRPGEEAHPSPGETAAVGATGLPGGRGRLVDCGTGSGVLAIAAARLGWRPVLAFDNDAAALLSAHDNVVENEVEDVVGLHESDVAAVPLEWFGGSTVLANMTLDPVTVLLGRLAGTPAERLIVSGILAGGQEAVAIDAAKAAGFVVGRRLYETEWVTLELIPARPERRGDGR